MISYIAICLLSTIFPYGMAFFGLLILFSCVSLDQGISALLVITPSRVMTKRRVRKQDGTTESLLVVRGRIVPADGTIKTIVMLCLTVGTVIGTALGLFVHSIFTIQYSCPKKEMPIQMTCYDWSNNIYVCQREMKKDIQKDLSVNRGYMTHDSYMNSYDYTSVRCIRYTGNVPFAFGAALACYKLIFIIFLVVTFLFDKMARKCGKCCCRFWFTSIYLTLAGLIISLLTWVNIDVHTPFVYQMFIIILGNLPLMYACYDIRSDQKQSVVVGPDEPLCIVSTKTQERENVMETQQYDDDQVYQRNKSHSLLRFLVERYIFSVQQKQKRRHDRREMNATNDGDAASGNDHERLIIS